ncbi:hypothetical protein ACVW1C_007375 [Bradyrhizobium sp. USDA 4011]
MSGHLRFCFAAFVLLAGLSTSSASSNPFSGFFNTGPAAAPAPTSAEVECLPRPGKSTADGQHWVYRVEGRRRCWFQIAEGTETVKKPVRHRAARHRAATAEEDKIAARKRMAVVDARAELQRSALEDTSRPSPSAPVLVVDAGPVLATGIATPVSPAPLSRRANDRPTPDEITPRQVDVEALLAAAPAASDVVAASAPSLAFSTAKAGDDGWGWTWLGMPLMALGLLSVLSASRTQWAVLLRQLSFACQRLLLVNPRPRQAFRTSVRARSEVGDGERRAHGRRIGYAFDDHDARGHDGERRRPLDLGQSRPCETVARRYVDLLTCIQMTEWVKSPSTATRLRGARKNQNS